MKTVRSINQQSSFRGRLPLKLALLFVGAFVAVLLAMVAWNLITTFGETRIMAADSDIQTPAIAIDPKIQTDLAKAMSLDAIPAEATVQNPFIDRAGIGSNVAVTSSPTVTNAVASSSPNATTGAANGSRTTIVSGLSGNAPSLMGPETDNTKARYEDWFNRQRSGYIAGPESETLGVDDLIPVGYADGGDRPIEVILFSISLCRTFSYPVGTRFYNAVLSEIKPSEVVFAVDNGTRRKSYSQAHLCNANPSVGAGDMN